MLLFHYLSLQLAMLGLVLGGGAAKGYAHIGVLEVMEQEGIQPDIVVGASMGALVGGFFAAGYKAKTIEDIAIGIDKRKKRWLFKPHISKKGFISGRNVVKLIFPYLQGRMIEELPIKFAAVATDIERHQEIIIDRGSLIQGIRAAIAIPVVFTPHDYEGRVLIDGGFVNPLPIDVAKRLGANKIIAVNVLRKVDYTQESLSSIEPSLKKYSMKKIFVETFDYITSRLIDYGLAELTDGIVIHVDTRSIRLSDFEKAGIAIELGHKQAEKHRHELRAMKQY